MSRSLSGYPLLPLALGILVVEGQQGLGEDERGNGEIAAAHGAMRALDGCVERHWLPAERAVDAHREPSNSGV